MKSLGRSQGKIKKWVNKARNSLKVEIATIAKQKSGLYLGDVQLEDMYADNG